MLLRTAAREDQPTQPYRIDTHHHIVPPHWLAARRETILGAMGNEPSVVLDWTPERSLAEMDAHGIATAIASITTPGVWFGDVAEARRLARACNEYGAQLARAHPGRFGMFAALPLPDVEGSLAELAYALDVLGLDGIGLLTSYDEKWPGDPAFAPLFDELNRRKGVAFFHPTSAACSGVVVGDIPPSMTEYGFNTTRAITSLVFSGTVDRCPDVRFLFCHGGGTIPMLAHRIAATSYTRRPAVRERLPGGPLPRLRSLYVDVVSVANPPAMAALRAFMPPERLLFGTDYPFVRPAATLDGLGSLALPADDLAALERGNALALFPRYARRS